MSLSGRMAAVATGCRKPWSALGGHFSAEVFSDWRALTIEHSAMNGCGQKNTVAQVSKANSWQKWKYR